MTMLVLSRHWWFLFTCTGVIALLLHTEVIAQRILPSIAPQILFSTFILVFLLSPCRWGERYIPAPAARSEPEESGHESQAFLNIVPGHAEAAPQPDKPAAGAEPVPALFKNDPGLLARETPPVHPRNRRAPHPPRKRSRAPNAKAEEERRKVEKEKVEKAKVEAAEAAEPEIETPPKIAAIAVLECQRIVMTHFLTGLLTVLKDVFPKLDTYITSSASA